jgi:hypothetical protein
MVSDPEGLTPIGGLAIMSSSRQLSIFCVLVLLATGARLAAAQEPFGDPFASAETLRKRRGDMADATLRLRYEVSGDLNAEQAKGGLVIEVAADWAHVQRLGHRALYDFRLGRVLDLSEGGFVSSNLVGNVAFRIYERQNRTMLAATLRGAGAGEQISACDSDTELGLAIPGAKDTAAIAIKRSDKEVALECNGGVIGAFQPGSGDAAPAALWPVLAHVIALHPALRSELIKDGRVPGHIKSAFAVTGVRKETSWRLVSAEAVSVPYPLDASLKNGTAAWINKAVAPGLGDLAAAAVAGHAEKGPPTLASWEAEVSRVAKTKGAAAAVFAAWPALNMFPQVAQVCKSAPESAVCGSIRGLAATAQTDAAVRALLQIIQAEQGRRPGDAVAAMLTARSSPLADHPALAAAFALALQGGGQSMAQQARAAGLPSDAKALHVRALQAYPYNPAYWTDLGDYFARGYDLFTAYALYDVALSLPMPDAQRGNTVLTAKRRLATRIQADFPAFFLAR